MSVPPTVKELIGFIGGGQMATAMSEGFVRAGHVAANRIIVSDPSISTVEKFRAHGFLAEINNEIVVKQSDVVICAVKPNVVKDVLPVIRQYWAPSKILLSICAGISTDYYERALGSDARIIRVMPNTACLVGESASAFCCTSAVSQENVLLIQRIMSSVGKILSVPENLMDAVTGLSGSGPAYVFMMIEALSDAGVKNGLPRAVARLLAAQTVYGSAAMVLKTENHPAVLKEQVTSPGGTTIAGIAELEKTGFRSSIISAVDASVKRSEELGKYSR